VSNIPKTRTGKAGVRSIVLKKQLKRLATNPGEANEHYDRPGRSDRGNMCFSLDAANPELQESGQ